MPAFWEEFYSNSFTRVLDIDRFEPEEASINQKTDIVFLTPNSGAFDVYINNTYFATVAAGEDYFLNADTVYEFLQGTGTIRIEFIVPSTLVAPDPPNSGGYQVPLRFVSPIGATEDPVNDDAVGIRSDLNPTFNTFMETLMADHLNWLAYLDVLKGFYPSLESNIATTTQKVLESVNEMSLHLVNIEPFAGLSNVVVDNNIISDVTLTANRNTINASIDSQINTYNQNGGLKDDIDDAFDAVVAFIEKTSNASRTYNNPLVRNSLETLNVSTAKPELQAYKANLSAQTDIEFVEGVLKGQAVQLLNSTDTALDTFITGIQNLLNSSDSTSIIALIEQLRAAEVE